MDDMKWSSSGMLGVLAVTKLGFDLAITKICQHLHYQKYTSDI